MKLTVKTLKGSHFQITVQINDTIMAVKKKIEDAQGKNNYPCGQLLLIHNGKVLKDESTLAENKVSEDNFLVVMLTKGKSLGSTGSTSSQPAPIAAPLHNSSSATESLAPQPIPNPSGTSTPVAAPTTNEAASNLLAGNNLEQTIQQIMDMGGGSWDKETVTRALRAAYNNPERAVDYLYSGIPESTEVSAPLSHPSSVAPNSSPLNLFPQETNPGADGGGGIGSLDFLRGNRQFQALRTMFHANPQILQPMLQELGKENPSLLTLIQENQPEFLQLLNEPADGSDEEMFEEGEEDMPHTVTVTPEEEEAIERMEAMGFERELVMEAFLACDRNEELAINYLLENAGDFQDG